MKFLADQDVWQATIDLLISSGHDLVTAKELGMSKSSDEDVLSQAYRDKRILITRDKDFGHLVFAGNTPCSGVILLRVRPIELGAVHHELLRVLQEHDELELQRSFTIVEPGRHRIRTITYVSLPKGSPNT